MAIRMQGECQVIGWCGDTWRIVGRGVTNEDGARLCHLSSVTRFRPQRNGMSPVQMCDFVPAKILNGEEG